MAGLLTIMGVMIIAIFLKLIWHSCRRESKEMSHGRRAVRYQCPSRDDESNDYGESEGQCGTYHMFPQSSLLPPRFHQPQTEPVRALRIALTSAPPPKNM
jgi:FtsZ-interacting cell division protein ZipA